MAGQVLKIGDRYTSAHNESTLLKRLDLANAFLDAFAIGTRLSNEAFDEWLVENKRMDVLSEPDNKDSPEWALRLKQRNTQRGEINFGGKCQELGIDRQFQVERVGNEIWEVSPLTDVTRQEAAKMLQKGLTLLDNRTKEIERKINAIGIDNMGLEDRIQCENTMEAVDDAKIRFAQECMLLEKKVARLHSRLDSPQPKQTAMLFLGHDNEDGGNGTGGDR